jgi:hypothetical protein
MFGSSKGSVITAFAALQRRLVPCRRSVAAPPVAALCAAVAVCLCGAAPAHAFVYWAESGSPGLGRADLDGSNQTQDFLEGTINASGVALDGAHIYWSNRGGNSIGRANLDGSGADQNFITGALAPDSVAIGGGFVYWNNFPDPAHSSIGRANLDGSSPNQNLISFPFPASQSFSPRSLAADDAHVYWRGGAIGRANLDGTGATQTFIPLPVRGAGTVAIAGGQIYWGTGTSIGRANVDGTNVNENFLSVATPITSLAVDATHVYWTSNNHAIGRANLDGTSQEPSFITCVGISSGVAVDALSAPPPSPFPPCRTLPPAPIVRLPGPTPPAPPIPPISPPPALTASIRGKSPFRVKVPNGAAVFPMTISCPSGTTTCTAALTLRSRGARPRTLSKKTVTVAAGTRLTARMSLSTSARRLLSRRRSLRATLTITARRGATRVAKFFTGRLVK